MYNSYLYNTTLYGSLGGKTSSGGGDIVFETVAFNGYDFSDIIISNIPDDYHGLKLDTETYELSTHGQGIGNWLIKNKSLTIKGRIVAQNELSLEEIINKIKAKILQGVNVLYLKRKGGILQTNAVVSGFSVPRESWTINSAQITITFSILDPFMYSKEKHEIVHYGLSNNFYTSLFYESGSYAAKPVIYLMFGNGTSLSSLELSIGKKVISINERFTAGDILILDGEKVDIAKNGRYGIDWIGEFGSFEFGENSISVICNGVAKYSLFIQYRDTYV